ncbi:J domain-containing protein [Leptolyngbya sp. PCC 6406]|uniref:J domain-containing protein n=1 Tax=Leptolyngbya sp. PCC 6406 TaxID=1173264 RepID=UPI0002FFC4B8|nr:J domain-containing protein [Leptolyngbya sp. PCC 6406]
MANSKGQTTTHYTLLGLKPTASVQQIRQAYRDRSKLYHPDTTELPDAIATAKFQSLNEAYATLSSPERRLAYDHSIGYSRIAVVQAPAYLNRPASERSRYEGTNAYLDPTDRPLSAGELFALFILGVTFVCCLMLVVAVSFTRGNLIQATAPTPPPETSTMPAPAPDAPDPAPSLPTPKDSVPPDPLPTLTL